MLKREGELEKGFHPERAAREQHERLRLRGISHTKKRKKKLS